MVDHLQAKGQLIHHPVFQGTKGVRVFGTFENPLFVAADVCACLGIGNHRMALQRVDSDDVSLIDVIDDRGRTQSTSVVNESGLYALVLTSRKPEAKAFKKWATKEVFPAIRKTGRYDRDEQMRNLVFDRFLLKVPQPPGAGGFRTASSAQCWRFTVTSLFPAGCLRSSGT